MTQTNRPPMLLMIAIGMLCTITLVVFALAYGLVMPGMLDGLGLDYGKGANLGTVTALGYLTMLMVAGIFASRYGSKQPFLSACALRPPVLPALPSPTTTG